jgi:hypothetical protein
MTVTQAVIVADDSGILEVLDDYKDCALDFVYDFSGKKYPAEKDGIYITIGDTPPEKGNYLNVVMIQDTVKMLDAGSTENASGGYYRITGIQSRSQGIDGLYYTAPPDIVKIGSIVDAEGKTYTPDELRLDQFHINPLTDDGNELPIVEPITVEDVQYVPPFLFALLSQNLSKEDADLVLESHGDAVLTFPYNCNVAEGDVITVLSASYTNKEVVKKVEGSDDALGAYFVADVISCIGLEREYKEGVDFILIGTNYIKWLCDDAPVPGEAYSLSYKICPTYKVIKNIPQVRSSENQRLPKKAVVQLFSTYGEKRKVNRQ